MDQAELQEQIGIYYSKLPQDLQEVFSKMEWLDALTKLSTKYQLNDTQLETLTTETTLALLGIIKLEEYEEAIRSEVVPAAGDIDGLVTEINNLIFRNWQNTLASAYNKNFEDLAVDQIKEELDERFEKLPAETKESILDINYHGKLYAISQKYNLTVEQMGEFEGVTTDLIVGTIKSDRFEEEIQRNVGTNPETTRNLVGEVNEKILRPLRLVMEGVKEEKVPNKYEIKPQPPIGIKIVKPDLSTPELPAGKLKNEIVGIINTRPPEKKLPPILGQKLGEDFKAPTVKTEYSINRAPKPAENSASDANAKNYPPKRDPYRVYPDEE